MTAGRLRDTSINDAGVVSLHNTDIVYVSFRNGAAAFEKDRFDGP